MQTANGYLVVKIVLCSLLLSISSIIVAQQDDDAPTGPATLQALDERLADIIENSSIPGAAVSLVDASGNEVALSYGYANLKQQTKVTSDTLFRIGSISKMFVSLAALKLENEGKLDLQAEVKTLAPEIEFQNPYADTHPVRVVHLLEHTAGWDDIHLIEYASNDPSPLTLKQGLDLHPHSRISRWPPGERMSYSNSGPPTVAYIIQKITGVDFEEYIQQHFFEPIGMTTADYRQPDTDTDQATLYQGAKAVEYWHISKRPSGSINASALDMLAFLKFFVQRGEIAGERILSADAFTRMQQPQSSLAAKAGLSTGYALNNYTTFHEGIVLHGHNGGVNGGASEFLYHPASKVGYTMMINSGGGQAMDDLSTAIREYLFNDLVASKPAADIANLDQSALKEYEGWYMNVTPRQEMMRFFEQLRDNRKINVSENKLTMFTGDKSYDYVAVTDATFRLEDREAASLALLNDNSGNAIQINTSYYQQISSFRHYTQQTFFWLFLASAAAHLLWFWVWLVRRSRKKIPAGPAIQIRVWPFMASLSVLTFIAFMVAGQVIDALQMMGNFTWVSVGMYLSTYAFAIFALVSLVQNLRFIRKDINLFARLFCISTTLVFVVAAIYFARFDVIGLKTWA